MASRSDRWVALFSGGKDSSYALWLALERGLAVDRLVTVHPPENSHLYHVPATALTALAGESIGIPVVDVRPEAFDVDAEMDSSARGDAEIEPLEATLAALDDDADGKLAGIVVGAVESRYQHDRITSLADRLECDVFAPLWRRDPLGLLESMVADGFEIMIVDVAAAGLDDSWLGRTIDDQTIDTLEALRAEYGVHPIGEGGEYETLVVDGPHMDRKLAIEYEPTWDGTRGSIDVTDARLVERDD